MRRRAVWIGVAVALVVGLVVLASPIGFDFAGRAWRAVAGDDMQGVPIEGVDLGGTGPGSLVSAVTMPRFLDALDRERKTEETTQAPPSGATSATTPRKPSEDIRAARVVYASTNGETGEATKVSAAVFTPVGDAPQGGWPIVALAHQTTGFAEECAPSLTKDLWGLSDPVVNFVKAGYAVALADYEGLGQPGVHPYGDSKTAGLNVIDSVRALRHVFPNTSPRWLAFGGSQGGGAAWAADEQAARYAPELDLVGAVANSPMADLAGLVAKAQAGELSDDQMLLFLGVVESIARLHPEVNRSDFRSGAAANAWVTLLSCDPATGGARTAARGRLEPEDFAPRTRAAAEQLQALLAKWALPQGPLSAPLSVDYGAKDDFIDSQWTTDALARQCALGGSVQWDLQPDSGHGDVDISGQFAWLADRFAGKPAISQCP